MNELKVGDRVTRFHDPDRKKGVIISIYSSRPDLNGRAQSQYEVKWDDGTIDKHYLILDKVDG